MSVVREVCPFHADDDVLGVPTGHGDGSVVFTCTRSGHLTALPHTWLRVPEPEDVAGVDGFAVELGLATELPAALAGYLGTWVEYGLVERAYALRQPGDFAAIVAKFGHNALAPRRYTTSAFIARTLGALGKFGSVLYHGGPATGRWSYNTGISWWALAPAPDWDKSRLSWEGSGHDMSYVPGVGTRDAPLSPTPLAGT